MTATLTTTNLKFRVERGTLADAVAWTAKSLPTKPSVPVLAGAMLRVADSTLTVSSFDYETSSQTGLDVHDATDGAALVSGRLLAEIAKALPNKPVDVTTHGTHLQLVCGSARFTLPTMPVEDYPTLPEMPGTAGTVDAALFATAVAQVAVAAGREDTLPILTGVLLEFDGPAMALVATDRYRMAIRQLEWQPEQPDGTLKALVPAKILADTAKTLGPLGGAVTVALGDNGPGQGMIGFAAGARQTTSRLLDGDYPKVRALLPDHHNSRAHIPVAELVEVVRRVALVADRATPVRLSFTADELVVEAGGEDARGSDTMPVDYEGEPLQVAFNPNYLVDALLSLHTEVAVLSITEPRKPALLNPGDADGQPDSRHHHVLMPIRIGG